MPTRSRIDQEKLSSLDEVKLISGRTIEERRRHLGMTQERLAARAAIGVRWLREIEAGNPRPSIEDHLRCAAVLGLSPAYLLIPLMFMANKMTFPRQLLLEDLDGLERRCIRCIGEHYLDRLGQRLRPGAADQGCGSREGG